MGTEVSYGVLRGSGRFIGSLWGQEVLLGSLWGPYGIQRVYRVLIESLCDPIGSL